MLRIRNHIANIIKSRIAQAAEKAIRSRGNTRAARQQVRAHIHAQLPRIVRNQLRTLLLDPEVRAHIIADMQRELYVNFVSKSQHGPGLWGEPWHALKPSTIAQKRRTHPDNAELINVRSGRLREALKPTTPTPSGYIPSPDQHLSDSPNHIKLGIRVPYAKYVNAQRQFTAPPETYVRSLVGTLVRQIKRNL